MELNVQVGSPYQVVSPPPEKNGQIPLIKVAEIDPCSLLIDRKAIINNWELGIWSNLAFIFAAVLYDQRVLVREGREKEIGHYKLDIENFIVRWQGTPDHDTNRIKRLTKRHVMTAIAILEEKGVFRIHDSQLSLDLDP